MFGPLSRWRQAGAFLLVALLALPLFAAERIRLATTTSTYNSGLLDALLPEFERATGIQVQVLSVGTGQALRLGRDGDVDLVMTHAPAAEEAFVEAGHGIDPRRLMYNDFVLVGPANDPVGLRESEGVVEAFERMARGNTPFISRGDDSGTHKKELEIWALTQYDPSFAHYHAVGQGMGRVLLMASEMQGYTLTDRGTWLAMRQRLDLELLAEGSIDLANPYQVILVNPQRHPHVQLAAATQFRDWLVSAEGQALIGRFTVDGEPLFFPDAD